MRIKAGDAVPGAGVGGRGVPLGEEFVGRVGGGFERHQGVEVGVAGGGVDDKGEVKRQGDGGGKEEVRGTR